MGYANDLKSRKFYLDDKDSAMTVFKSFPIIDDLVLLATAIDSGGGGGGVSSVLGTLNRITSSGGANPIIDISPSYIGQSSINTVGTLISGSTGSGFTINLSLSTISGILSGANGGTGVNNSGRTITLGGNLATSGSFNTTFVQQFSGNITLPNGAGTLSTLSRVETFSNKTLDNTNIINVIDSQLLIESQFDATARAVFDCSAITSGRDRVLTVQDADGTIAYLSDLGGFVPYIGATSNVILGNFSLTSRSVIIGSASNTIALGSTAGVSSFISTTTNASKGNVTIGSIYNIDEANSRARLGTPTTPDLTADFIIGSSQTTRKPIVLQLQPSHTANAFEIQRSNGSVLTAMSSTTGGFSIGITPSNQWLIGTTYNFPENDGISKYGFLNVVSITATSGVVGQIFGGVMDVTNSVGASVFGSLIGSSVVARFNSSGFVFGGFFVGQEISMQTLAGQTGVVTDSIALRLNVPTFSGNKPGVNYGILINNQGLSGVSQSYGINIAAQSGATSSYAFASAAGNLHGFGTLTPTEVVDVTGNIQLNTAGNGIRIKSGSNARIGNSVMVSGTVVVVNTSVTSNTIISLSAIGTGVSQPNAGSLSYSINPGVGFTIYSTSSLDSRVVNWVLFESF